MKNSYINMLPDEQVKAIQSFITSKEEEVKHDFFNRVMRDDIFRLLEKQPCVVIYYPLDDESNNGFHVEYYLHREKRHFVYINTAHERETQIFTAAHELGHIWELIKYMNDNGFSGNEDWEEQVINRFAAELLMPVNEFKIFALRSIDAVRKHYSDHNMTVGDMIQAATAIMNEFFTPYKAVVTRLYELRIISNNTIELLLDEDNKDEIKRLSKSMAKEQGYTRLYQPPDRYKWIEGLKELLDKARDCEAFPEKWLESLYNQFDFDISRIDDEFKTPLPDDVHKGGESDV